MQSSLGHHAFSSCNDTSLNYAPDASISTTKTVTANSVTAAIHAFTVGSNVPFPFTVKGTLTVYALGPTGTHVHLSGTRMGQTAITSSGAAVRASVAGAAEDSISIATTGSDSRNSNDPLPTFDGATSTETTCNGQTYSLVTTIDLSVFVEVDNNVCLPETCGTASATNTVQVSSGCQLRTPPTHFSQGIGGWENITYNNYNDQACRNPNAQCEVGNDQTCCRIRRLGCALTTLAMALTSAGVSGIDPGVLNAFMRIPNTLFDSDHNVKFDATAGALSNGRLKLRSAAGDPRSTDALSNGLCTGFPVIVGIHLDSDTDTGEIVPEHYVLVTGKDINNNFQILDPGDASNNVLNPTDFLIRGSITDPAGDVSRMDLSVGNNAEVMAEDAAGRRTGFDPVTRTVVQGIPGATHFIDSLRDDETGTHATTRSHTINIFQPSQGIYQIVLTGLKLGTYALSLDSFASDGSKHATVTVSGVTAPGSTSTFTTQFVSTPGAVVNVIRFATFSSTLADIGNSLQLGLIDDHGVANSLSQKILAAQSATGPARNNILNAFKHEVDAQANKHITGVAVQVLLEDADSLIGQNL